MQCQNRKAITGECDVQELTLAPASPTSRLAIDGGTPVRSAAFASWPQFEADEVEAVAAVLRSGKVNYWTGGQGSEFEREYADYTGTKHAIAVANGTVALELALYASGVGPGDEVVTASRTFIASASCIAMRGATPVFADIDRDSQNVTARTLRAAITPRTRALIAIHHAGWPCEMDAILDVAAQHKLIVIEDCAQAHGARYQGRAVGSIGHIGAFSFCQDKIMTTGGEGGMVTTNDETLWQRAWSFKDHGKSVASCRRRHESGVRFKYESVGTNWRLTEMQSALGRVLLRKLDARVEQRRHFAKLLDEAFSRLPSLRVTPPPHTVRHSYYKYYVFVRPERLRKDWNRDRIVQAIVAEGIPCVPGTCSEIYLEKVFEGNRPERRLSVAKELGETSLRFVVHPTLEERDIQDTIRAVRKVIDSASTDSRGSG